MSTIGINEALILAALSGRIDVTIAEIAGRVSGDRAIDEGTIYIALQRMAKRGLVTAEKTGVVSSDGRPRQIGVYTITRAGTRLLSDFERDAALVRAVRHDHR